MIMSYIFINACRCVSVSICHVCGCSHRPEEGIRSSELELQTAGCVHLDLSAGCSIMEPSLQPPLTFFLNLSLVLDDYFL